MKKEKRYPASRSDRKAITIRSKVCIFERSDGIYEYDMN